MVKPLVAAVVLTLLACAPPTDGATCLRHDNCPDTQACTDYCLCATGERGVEQCSGFKQTSVITLEASAASAIVQVSSTANVASVWVSANRRGKPEARQFKLAQGRWDSLGGFELADGATSSPMGLSPSGTTIAIRTQDGVSQWTVGEGLGSVDLWFSSGVPGGAKAVAHAGNVVVASFSSLGVRQKSVQTAVSLADGTPLDADSAEELQISNDTNTVAARFGINVRLYFNSGPVRSWSGVLALDLSADGTSLAMVRDGGVDVDVSGQLESVALPGARVVSLNGNGRVLVAVGATAPAVFTLNRATWTRVGALPISGSDVASSVAVSDDGNTLFVGMPGQKRVLVFGRIQ